MADLNVLIVGASVAGPMAAYWLSRAGANITVIERFPALRTGGQNIDIRTSGVTVMRRVPGLEAAVRAKLAPIDGVSLVRDDGTPIAVMRSTGDVEAQGMISEYEVFRGVLSRLLVDLTEGSERVKYVFNEQVKSMRQEGDGKATVEFLNGYPTGEYDLVVACDGATSRTRAIGLGCDVRDYTHPTNLWGAYFPLKTDILKGSRIGLGRSAVGGRFLAIGIDTDGRNRAGCITVKPQDGTDACREFREASKQGDAALRRYVAKTYEGAGWIADQVMKEMLEADDFYASENVQVKLPTLYKGRFVLVGDAGYAPGPTGTGTSLALTGAYVLAGEISRHQGDLAAGLAGYEERMQPIIKEMQKMSPGVLGIMAPQTAWGIRIRNFCFIVVSWLMKAGGFLSVLTKAFTSTFGGAAFAGDKTGLPEYEWVNEHDSKREVHTRID